MQIFKLFNFKALKLFSFAEKSKSRMNSYTHADFQLIESLIRNGTKHEQALQINEPKLSQSTYVITVIGLGHHFNSIQIL